MRTKPMSMSTRCQVGCPAIEKPLRGQDAMGTPTCRFSRWWKSCRGVWIWWPAFPLLLFRVTWAGQRGSEWDGLVTDGENSQVRGLVVPGCLVGEQCSFCIRCTCKMGEERIVPYGVGGLSSFFVFLFILVLARHGCRATIWRAVLATA